MSVCEDSEGLDGLHRRYCFTESWRGSSDGDSSTGNFSTSRAVSALASLRQLKGDVSHKTLVKTPEKPHSVFDFSACSIRFNLNCEGLTLASSLRDSNYLSFTCQHLDADQR